MTRKPLKDLPALAQVALAPDIGQMEAPGDLDHQQPEEQLAGFWELPVRPSHNQE